MKRKEFFNLQLFADDDSRAALIRHQIADYLEVGGAYELCGVGFTQLNENPGAQTDSTTYINEVTASSSIIGYETEFPYQFDAIPRQKALYALWKDGRDHHTGTDAQHTFLKVDLFNPIGEVTADLAEFTARKFVVSNEVSSNDGDGGQKITASGTLHAVGDPVQGKFDTVSKTFTAGDFKGKYDVDVPVSITLDKSTASVAVGATDTITATVEPSGTAVTWQSSDASVATVADGVVTGVAAGSATITATITVNGTTKTATCAVTVTE